VGFRLAEKQVDCVKLSDFIGELCLFSKFHFEDFEINVLKCKFWIFKYIYTYASINADYLG